MQLSTKRMWLLNSGRSTFHWWLRLMVAAFLLSAWVAVGLASGIAHADDPSPSGGDSSSESSPAPKASTPIANRQPGGPPQGRSAAEDSVGRGNPPARKPHTGNPARTTNRGTTADTTTESSPSESKATAERRCLLASRPSVRVQPSTPAPVAAADPDDPPKPRVRPNSHRPGLTIASAKPAKPIPADPQPSAIGATSHRSAVAPIQQPPKQASIQLPAVANVAPTGPSASSTQSGASPGQPPATRQQIHRAGIRRGGGGGVGGVHRG